MVSSCIVPGMIWGWGIMSQPAGAWMRKEVGGEMDSELIGFACQGILAIKLFLLSRNY